MGWIFAPPGPGPARSRPFLGPAPSLLPSLSFRAPPRPPGRGKLPRAEGCSRTKGTPRARARSIPRGGGRREGHRAGTRAGDAGHPGRPSREGPSAGRAGLPLPGGPGNRQRDGKPPPPGRPGGGPAPPPGPACLSSPGAGGPGRPRQEGEGRRPTGEEREPRKRSCPPPTRGGKGAGGRGEGPRRGPGSSIAPGSRSPPETGPADPFRTP